MGRPIQCPEGLIFTLNLERRHASVDIVLVTGQRIVDGRIHLTTILIFSRPKSTATLGVKRIV